MQCYKTLYNMKYILAIIFIFINSTILASNTTQATDSLLALLKTTKSPQKRIQTYRNLADISLDTPEFKTYLLRMYQEAFKIKDKESMLDAIQDIMIEEIKAEEKDSVLKYTEYIKQIASPKELKYLLPYFRMRFFDSLCYTENKVDDINKELSFLISKDSNDIYNNIASTYNVGTSYYMRRKPKDAEPYIEKAMKLAESLPDKEKYIYQKFILWRLCFTYARNGKNKESINLMENLIKLTEQIYKTDYQKQRPFYKIDLYLLQYYAFMISNLPYLTKEQERYYWDRIQKTGKALTSDADKYNYYLCANNYYTSNHTKVDLPKAIAANDSLIRIAKNLAAQNLPSLYSTSSMLYERAKDYQNALKFLRISHQIKDSLNSETASKQLNELQVKYDLNTLNNENALLEIKNKQTQLISLTILLIILISISTYFYFSWKKERKMKLELKRLHGKAQESEKMKQEFINSICHEIRTPLNGIVGFSDLIMNEDIDIEMRREFPAEIQKSTALLTSLVNSMLEVANLDVSDEKLPCCETDLTGICVQEMEQIKRKPEIDYILDIAEESTFIMTNSNYLSQVVGHLLSNANKFTEQGKIILSYKLDDASKRAHIIVADTGRGIPLDKHEEVFERFYKIDSFVPGNGLGLYLCQLIIKRLGGEIKIDSEYTTGTRIIVTLPIE